MKSRPLVAAVLAFALLPPAVGAAEVDPYVPADAEWVLHCNLKQLAESAAVKKHGTDLLRAGLDALKPLTALGIDPLHDVHTVTAAGSEFLQPERVLLIVRGGLDANKLRKTADRLVKEDPAAWKALKQGDTTLYEWRDKAQAVYFAVAADGTVLASRGKKYVATAAALDPKRPAPVSQPLRELVKRADARDDVWLAAVKSERVQKLLAKGAQTANIADDVTAFSGRLRVRDDVRIAFSVHTKDKRTAEEAAQLLDAAKGFAVLAVRGAEGAGPLLPELIDGCTTSTDGGTATLAGQLSAEQIAKVLKKL